MPKLSKVTPVSKVSPFDGTVKGDKLSSESKIIVTMRNKTPCYLTEIALSQAMFREVESLKQEADLKKAEVAKISWKKKIQLDFRSGSKKEKEN